MICFSGLIFCSTTGKSLGEIPDCVVYWVSFCRLLEPQMSVNILGFFGKWNHPSSSSSSSSLRWSCQSNRVTENDAPHDWYLMMLPHMEVSINRATPTSHPFLDGVFRFSLTKTIHSWGTPMAGNPHIILISWMSPTTFQTSPHGTRQATQGSQPARACSRSPAAACRHQKSGATDSISL